MLNAEIFRYVLQKYDYFCKVRKWFVIIKPNSMDLNATLDIIIKDLNELREIIDDIRKYEGVPVLQIEIAKSKCKSAAEVIALLKNMPVSSATGSEEKKQKPEPIPANVEVKSEESPGENHIQLLNSFAGPEEKNKIEINQIKAPEMIPEIKKKPEMEVKRVQEAGIIADQFSNRPESYNETLGGMKHDDDVSEILKTKPLTNLSEAIGINDKFFFIREIFNGDQESYNGAISKLDSAGNLNDARAVMSGYIDESTDKEAIKQLMDLLKRKFHTNE